ncbi:uncharacterized protein L969DRAFT_94043 [Mixia osmundae IAM 14324]|uniref:Rab-GAP TBC domain-containing protein n=1 Tax=Mixia osmundae (strain CBS 9802 / IAM 14324 / JCM 22182 / KY 12970) TaxID=764103 RepID=G7E8X2_MIXOS|nr:uncharacterized protein L969DRAFT_94043 [Mixia osmundae IAM 14324]KEI40225.1 hypothetical protein L969DRAFT_94043 [Mixia osmundae IAM 14324]GAA99590.1 hypothetical protein E5Q_06291 [Mixia osmundae IAM 14324]
MAASTPTAQALNSQLNHDEAVRAAIDRRDVAALRRLASRDNGFSASGLRSQAWLLLLGGTLPTSTNQSATAGPRRRKPDTDKASSDDGATPSEQPVTPHRDEGQVAMDVNRSFIYYPQNATPARKQELQKDLNTVIVSTLRRHPALSYFQGFHDIVSVILLSLEDVEDTIECVEHLSLYHIRDSMGFGMDPVIGYLRVLKRILDQASPALSQVVNLASALPYFSLSWVLCLMSHDITSLDVSARLFDFLFAHNPILVAYFGVAILLTKQGDLDEIDPDLADDPAVLHTTLARMPVLLLEPEEPLPMSPPPKDGNNDEGLYSDPDIDVPALMPTPPLTPPLPSAKRKGILLQDILDSTLDLYARYPFDGPNVRAKEILGPCSAVYTWRVSGPPIPAEQAEEILRRNADIVYPPPAEEQDKPAPTRPLRQDLAWQRQTLMLAAVGLAGLLLATYGAEPLLINLQQGMFGRWMSWATKTLIGLRER